LDYQIPLNARNGKFRFFFAHSESQVIEDPFSILEIRSGSNNWDFSFRQPILQTTAQEFSTTIGINNRATETSLEIGDERIGFPLSEGANDNGDTSITVVRFAQEWIRRTPNQVLGLRSQFNFGTNWFGATVNDQATGLPDGEFFTWQGQGQWVRQFAPDTILLVRSNLQMADRPLLSLEQFGVGGANSVRGYRQDRILADNGLFSSIEARIPIFRIPQIDSVAQIAPFIDYGVVWSSGDRPDPDPGQLLSVGLGLRWQFADHINARLDWGFPLMNDEQNNNTLQEQGILFSITADMTR
jgi:hemolysin activation/secretion protein